MVYIICISSLIYSNPPAEYPADELKTGTLITVEMLPGLSAEKFTRDKPPTLQRRHHEI